MEAETLEALKGSIAIWERRAAGEWIAVNARNCPLCVLFNRDHQVTSNCHGCPVYETTGEKYCESTPCEQYFPNGNAENVAEEELAFLRSLLPSASSEDGKP